MYESNLQEMEGTLTLAEGAEPGTIVIGASSAEGWEIASCQITLKNFGKAVAGLSHVDGVGRGVNLHRLIHSDKTGADAVKFHGLSTLARTSRGMRYQLKDEAAGTVFLHADFSEEQLAELILRHSTGVKFQIRNPERLGRVYQSERRSIEYTGEPYQDREELEAWLAVHGKVDGWHVDARLGSQGSISTYNGVTSLQYSIYRYTR